MRVLLITKDNEILGNAIYTRYNALPWWKKVICFFSPIYKLKYIDIKGFDVEINEI